MPSDEIRRADAKMFVCACGHEARSQVDLDDHVGYMRYVDDPREHGYPGENR